MFECYFWSTVSTTIKVPVTFIVVAVEAGILQIDIWKLRRINPKLSGLFDIAGAKWRNVVIGLFVFLDFGCIGSLNAATPNQMKYNEYKSRRCYIFHSHPSLWRWLLTDIMFVLSEYMLSVCYIRVEVVRWSVCRHVWFAQGETSECDRCRTELES